MFKGENIVIFSSADWQTPRPTSPTHLSINYAKENKVLFIETFGSRIPSLDPEHIQRLAKRIVNWLKGIKTEENKNTNLYIYSPTAIMLNFKPFLCINRMIFLHIINRLLKKLGMDNPIMFFYLPPPLGVIKKLKAKAIVYHCIDEWATYPAGRNKIFMAAEKELIENSDLVIATNDLLYENKKLYAKRIKKIYHGVDYNHFTKEFFSDKSLPPDIINVPKPIIAVVGSFVDWMDLDLIKLIAEKHPDWSLVSIGPIDANVDIRDLIKMNNVYFLKAKYYSQLPDYYRAIDVFIVPFIITEHIKYSAPTRLYEHLSSGKPVVTTDFPAAHDVGEGLIRIANTRESFLRNIEEALRENDAALAEKRRLLAKANTWDRRVDEISTFISEVIKNDI
ncbi:MAG: glycosyltransferase [Candidatus Omnitrophota bacterium]